MAKRRKQPLSAGVIATAALLAGIGITTPVRAEPVLYIHGKIYTGATPGFADAMAVDGDTIVGVGHEADLPKSAGERVVGLHGRTVIPGIIDSHAHTLFGSLALHGLNLATPERTIYPDQTEAFVAAIRAFAAQHPAEKVLFLRAGFDISHPPDHSILDQAVTDRPVVVHNVSEHALWLNAKALELSGITTAPYPVASLEAGIGRRADGSPNGMVREAAMEIVERPILAMLTDEEKLAMIREGTHFLNSFGITAVLNATGNLAEIRLYGTLRDRKQLTVRTRTAFGAIASPHHLTPQFLSDIETARQTFHDDWVSADLIKFFMDGASFPRLPIYTPDEFKTLVQALDKRGYHIMTHALFSDSVTTVLNAYEAVEKEDGGADHRFRIEHIDRLMPTDLPRFAQLSVIASMQPSFCCSTEKEESQVNDQWNTMLKSGAHVAFSSDWPCTFPPNPFVAMQELTTREAWVGRFYGAGQGDRKRNGEINHPEERITIQQAVDGYTKGGAFASFFEKKLGTLEPGKLADFVVLNQDIFTIPSTQIEFTKPLATVVGGSAVFGSL